MRVIASVLTIVAVQLGAQPAHIDDPWSGVALRHLEAHPDERLMALVEALTAFNQNDYLPHSDTVRSTADQGWMPESTALEPLFQSQAAALASARRAADSERLNFPPTENFNSPVMNFLKMQSLARLMVAESRRAQSQGNAAEAVDEALDVVRLGGLLRAEGTPLVQHLIGVSVMANGLKAADDLIATAALSPEQLGEIQERLVDIQRITGGMHLGFETEGRMMLANLQQMGDPQIIGQELGPEERAALTAALANPASFEGEHNRLWSQIIAAVASPAWDRPVLDGNWLDEQVSNPLMRTAIPNFMEAATRADAVEARLRLCWALAAQRRGQDLSIVRDPFTGQPLSEDPLRSFGPDAADQQGQVLYDPTNGTVSAGDIIPQ